MIVFAVSFFCFENYSLRLPACSEVPDPIQGQVCGPSYPLHHRSSRAVEEVPGVGSLHCEGCPHPAEALDGSLASPGLRIPPAALEGRQAGCAPPRSSPTASTPTTTCFPGFSGPDGPIWCLLLAQGHSAPAD